MKLLYLAPADIQIARVDRKCIVSFCAALQRIGVGVELVAMHIKLLDVEVQASDPLELYGVESRFPVTLVRAPVHQESRDWWIAVNRLRVHLGTAFSSLRRGADQGPVVLYARNYAPALALLALRALSTRRPIVVLEAHLPPGNVLQRFVMQRVDRVIANSRALAADLVAARHVDPNRVIGVHQGVDLEVVESRGVSKRDARTRLGLPLDKKLVVYTGKIYWGYKEVEYIVEAARYLEGKNDVQFVLVGGRGDHVERFRARIAEDGLRNVSFVGFVAPRSVHLYQKAADALLLYYPSGSALNPYRSPGKLFDYMASGNPIVACDLPVLREVLGEDPAAVLVPPDSPSLLAGAVERILSDEAEAKRLGATARKRVEAFTWEARARSVVDFIANSSVNSGTGQAVTTPTPNRHRSAHEARGAPPFGEGGR